MGFLGGSNFDLTALMKWRLRSDQPISSSNLRNKALFVGGKRQLALLNAEGVGGKILGRRLEEAYGNP